MKKLYQKSHQNKKTAVYTKTIIKQKINEKNKFCKYYIKTTFKKKILNKKYFTIEISSFVLKTLKQNKIITKIKNNIQSS